MRSSKTRSNATPKGCRGAAPSADRRRQTVCCEWGGTSSGSFRSEEHTSELQSQSNLVCRLLLEKKKEVDEHRRAPEIQARVDACPELKVADEYVLHRHHTRQLDAIMSGHTSPVQRDRDHVSTTS